jgi:hypothetical protein
MHALLLGWLSVVGMSQCLILTFILLNVVGSDKSFIPPTHITCRKYVCI